MSKNEKTITEDDVRKEHLASVRPGPHWAYLIAILGGGVLLMLLLIAVMGAANGG